MVAWLLIGLGVFSIIITKIRSKITRHLYGKMRLEDFSSRFSGPAKKLVLSSVNAINGVYAVMLDNSYIGCFDNTCIVLCSTLPIAEEFVRHYAGAVHVKIPIDALFRLIVPFTHGGNIAYLFYTSTDLEACVKLSHGQFLNELLTMDDWRSRKDFDKILNHIDIDNTQFSLTDIETSMVKDKDDIARIWKAVHG